MRTFIGYRRTYCDCPECALNCQYIPGYLLPTDLPRIAAFHAVTFNPLLDWHHQCAPFRQFILENVLASPGALVLKGGRPCRIRTIVPARSDNGCCKFFDGRLCTIHPVAPFGCAFFDAHQGPRVSSAISGAGFTIIAKLWEEEPRSLYCQAWNGLYRKGRIAPSPEQCRHLMKNHTGENQAGFETRLRKEALSMTIYLYPENGHERLAIDPEELDKQIAWLHEQPMCDENEGIWNLLETIRDSGESNDQE